MQAQPQVQAQPVQQRASVQQAQPQVQATSATPVQPAKVQQAATPVQPKIQAQPIAKPESPFIDYDDEEPVAATAQTPVQSQVQAQPVQQQAPVCLLYTSLSAGCRGASVFLQPYHF